MGPTPASFRFRIGDVGTDYAKLTVVTTSSSPVTCTTLPNASIIVKPHNIRGEFDGIDGNPYLATVLVEISSLSALTPYTLNVSQDGNTLEGTFSTLPADMDTDFSFILSTCDGPVSRNPVESFGTIREKVATNSPPILFMAHIDDLHYADTFITDDSANTGLKTSGTPQVSKRPSDYAIAWAAHFGVLKSAPRFRMADRQWVYRNLPVIASGGDHMVADNHCRDGINNCDRGPGSNEEAGVGEWNAFIGQMNPPPLQPGALYWGKQVGPIRMTLWDITQTCQPYDYTGNHPDLVRFGEQQIGDLMDYMDTTEVPFKIALHESSISHGNQPWRAWHPNEAEQWYQDFLTRPNLNGQAGNFIVMQGDYHAIHAVRFDNFWSWCPGTLGGVVAFGARIRDVDWFWGGVLNFLHSNYRISGNDILMAAFIIVDVLASQNPKKIVCRIIESGSGKLLYQASLTQGATDNQFVEEFTTGTQQFFSGAKER